MRIRTREAKLIFSTQIKAVSAVSLVPAAILNQLLATNMAVGS